MSIENADFVILVFGIALIFLVYYFHQKLSERASGIQTVKNKIFKIIITFSPIVISLIILAIDLEKWYDTIIITVITGGISVYMHNLFAIKENSDETLQEVNESLKNLEAELKQNNDDYRNILCNPAYAFKANEKFSEILQNESYRVTKRYCEELETLEDRLLGKFSGSETIVDEETAKLLLSIASEKAISALDQFGRGKIFLRRELFKDFWKEAVQSSRSYLSICDLSIYNGLDESILETEKINWKRRIEDEIKALTEGKTKKFDKIILFDSSQNGSKNIIFSLVERWWQDGIKKLEDSHIKSHCQSGDNNSMIWTFPRDQFSRCLMNINSAREIKGQINSNDLGIFGDHLIGEEFKVNEVSTTIGELTDNDFDELKFLYRFSIQKDLVEKIKTMTIDKMGSCNSA